MSVSGYMAANIYGNGQTCNMGRCLLYSNAESCCSSAKALRSYSKLVDLFKYSLFHISIRLLCIFYANITAQSFFCKICTIFKVAAYSNA